MAWVEKDHSDHLVSTACYVQGCQPADQAAQSHIQPGLECHQGWGIRSLLGQPVQCVTPLLSDLLVKRPTQKASFLGIQMASFLRWTSLRLPSSLRCSFPEGEESGCHPLPLSAQKRWIQAVGAAPCLQVLGPICSLLFTK